MFMLFIDMRYTYIDRQNYKISWKEKKKKTLLEVKIID